MNRRNLLKVARVPVAPGNSDLCFRWDGPIADAKGHLEAEGVAIELGPVARRGAVTQRVPAAWHGNQ